jgi:hypothetical protein
MRLNPFPIRDIIGLIVIFIVEYIALQLNRRRRLAGLGLERRQCPGPEGPTRGTPEERSERLVLMIILNFISLSGVPTNDLKLLSETRSRC